MFNNYWSPWENSNTDEENDEISENSRSTVVMLNLSFNLKNKFIK